MIIKSRSVGLYPYAASLLIKESLKQKIQHSHLSQAVLNFLRAESGVHANDKLWTLRAAEKMWEMMDGHLNDDAFPPSYSHYASFLKELCKLRKYSDLRYVTSIIYAASIRSAQLARTKSKRFKYPQQIVEKCAENYVNLPIIAKCNKDACTEDACINKDACNKDACINKDACTEDACTEDACINKDACTEDACINKDACNKMIGFKKAYHKSMILTQDNYHRFNILNKKEDSISDISDKNHLSKAKACLKWLF